jgi:hypothetical protein
LADVWLRAADRKAITQAATIIDHLLALEPLAHGEEFYGDRILVVLPLAVTYAKSKSCKCGISSTGAPGACPTSSGRI